MLKYYYITSFCELEKTILDRKGACKKTFRQAEQSVAGGKA